MASGKPLASKTRQIESIPLQVLKSGKLHLLPVYQLAALSSVGKELILNQGSAKYQDLVYRNIPEGKFVLGKLFDRYLLKFPTAVGCRDRLAAMQDTLAGLIDSSRSEDTRILDLACGYGHCLTGTLQRVSGNGVRAWGIDLDDEAIAIATSRAEEKGIDNIRFDVGNVLKPEEYPIQSPDIVVLSGIAQYLDYERRMELYRLVYECLKKDGYLVSDYFCDWARGPVQRWWKRISEDFLSVHLQWLNREEVEEMFSQLPFREVKTWYTSGGICLMILARK